MAKVSGDADYQGWREIFGSFERDINGLDQEGGAEVEKRMCLEVEPTGFADNGQRRGEKFRKTPKIWLEGMGGQLVPLSETGKNGRETDLEEAH